MRFIGQLRRKSFEIGQLTALWVLLGGWAGVFAQGAVRQPVEFEVSQAAWAMRSGAPVPIRLKMTCSSSGIIEGALDIYLLDASLQETIGVVHLPDQVYSPGRQEVEYLIPIQSRSLSGALGVTSVFRDKNGPTYTSTGQLIVPSRRSFVVSIVRGREAAEVSRDDFGWLMLESWCPQHSQNKTISPMLTITPRIVGADLPRDPLKYLPQDIVVLEAGGFSELVGPQVQALESWAKGGGSLFLQIGEQELSSEQQAFVDRLTAKNPDVLDDIVEGTHLKPIIASGAGAPIEYGFGHVWLTTEHSWVGATEKDRLTALGFLWRLNQTQRDSLASQGKLSLEPVKREQMDQWGRYQNYNFQQPGNGPGAFLAFQNDELLSRWEMVLKLARSARPNEMIEALMPRDVQAVPVWLLASMLLLYIAAIGFGDYIILGKLKRRRWTWFTFPAMTLLVSLLSIGTAKGYLGTSQELSAVEFRDVAEDGSICRIDRFELLFHSSSGRAVTMLDNVAFTPVARQAPGSRNNSNGMETLDSQLLMIEGIPTAQATVTQQIEQWKPQLNRMVSFPRNMKAPVPFPIPGPGLKMSSPEMTVKVGAAIREGLPRSTSHMFLTSQGGFVGHGEIAAPSNSPEGINSYQLMQSSQPPAGNANIAGAGLFTLFEQISPSADTGLADMVVATPGHEVLCVPVREANNELVIYRWRFPVP